MAAKDELGRTGEDLAAGFLQAAGMSILARNWRCVDGELDILALDGRMLVAVEVKTRSGRTHGTAFEAVTQAKVRQLRALANRFRSARGECFDGVPIDGVRVDVVALERFAGDFSVRHERGLV